MEKQYWKSLQELKQGSAKDYTEDHEYVNRNEMMELVGDDAVKLSSNRRDFLKFFGFSLATSAFIASCKKPVEKAIPYLFKPEEVTPGSANFYASTYFNGDDYASVLVKVRDGRPIKIEGNELSSLSSGGTTARVQSSVLDLYDTARYPSPMADGNQISWEEADRAVKSGLAEAEGKAGKIVLLTGSVISPSTRALISDFINLHPGSEWVQYDPLSFSAMLEANNKCFHQRVIPYMDFSKAGIILSFGADFLGTWLMPGTFARQYADGRRVSEDKAVMSQHIQFESYLSLTGANADERVQIKPSEAQNILLYLYEKLQGKTPLARTDHSGRLDLLANRLKEMEGRSLVVCGYNDVKAQSLVNGINHLLANYGKTLDLTKPVNLRQGNDAAVQKLVEEMNRGEVAAVIIHNVNPVFDFSPGEEFAKGLSKVPLRISMAQAPDETSSLCNIVCPDNHYLESWGDAEPVEAMFSLQQPVIRPLRNTRQMQESLLIWSGKEAGYPAYLQKFWEKEVFNSSELAGGFQAAWNETLQKGVLEKMTGTTTQPTFHSASFEELIQGAGSVSNEKGIFELEAYQSVAIGSGRNANNPWLQELPDPVSKVCWDNYLAISVPDAESQGLETGDVVRINGKLNIPVVVQPGQTPGTVSIALGYGRKVAGRVAEGLGVHILPETKMINGIVSYTSVIKSLEKTGEKHKIAQSQTHHSMEGRAIVRETTLSEYRANPSAGNEMRENILKHMYTLYDEVKFEGLHWAMAIDLNACSGCSSCVIACQAENNIPVIGKEEIYRRRIMHWMRIDRYYSGSSENPGVHFMPVMCQHCDNAPCENVCPVAATNHSDEGLNQMAYIRCIGTKYCINNCPYKVRRFNWFNYTRSDEYNSYMNDKTGRLVLNPDVTVRERGIVEKCSFCIQRIQEAKIKAKTENRVLRDDEVMPACAQACPSKAIVFGNIADKNSVVYKLFKDKRNYHLLEELHTLPSVGYLTKVKNKQS